MSKSFVTVDRRVGNAMATIKRVYGYDVARLVRKDAMRVMSIPGATIKDLKQKFRQMVLDYESGKLADKAAS